MADKIFHSTAVTFVDMTDSRTLDVYISSNHSTVQICNSNKTPLEYTPDWSTTSLVLGASFYLDSYEIVPETIQWYAKIGTVETTKGNDETLILTTNELADNPIITYGCRITYDGMSAFKEITFTRVDSGRNGVDGTGVSIKGTAVSANLVDEENNYYTIVYGEYALKAAQRGDAYLCDGYLYVCVGLEDGDGNDYFINAGHIQGPPGKDGQDAKSIVLSGNSQVFKVSQDGTTYTPSTINITPQVINTSVVVWEYNLNDSKGWTSIAPAGVRVNGNNTITITGSDLDANSIVVKASDGSVEDIFTVYKAFDGVKGDSASMAFLTNENVTFAADADGNIPTTTITTSVVAYNGSQKVTPELLKNLDGSYAISNLPTGMSYEVGDVSNNEIPIIFTMTNNTFAGYVGRDNDTISIKVAIPNGDTKSTTDLGLTWSRVKSGKKGDKGDNGVDSYTVLLTNESHAFAGDVSHALDGIAKTSIIVYKGSDKQKVAVKKIDGKDAAIIETDTTIPGLKFKCSSLSSTDNSDVEITFTCTKDFKSENGTVPIVLEVNGVSFTKIFTYAIAFRGEAGAVGDKGNDGSIGPKGDDATSYWLVSSASAVQKTSTDTITVTPSTLTFAGKAKTGQNEPVDYPCRWVIEYSENGTNYTDLYKSTTNEYSKSIPVKTTYKTIRARMYMTGGTDKLLDEQIIPVVSDGISASLVKVTPSAYYFKSTNGKDGTFTPEYIYVYPRFQNVTFSKWEYSVDGGVTWVAASGANGLTVGTYSSTANTLRISRTSTLYTDTVTSISFRCVSSNAAVYDTVSIAKIYDIVDLQIGGTNLLPQSKMDVLPTKWNGSSYFTMVTEDGFKCAKLTGAIEYASAPYISIADKLNKINIAQEYTISAWVKLVNYVAGTKEPYCAFYIDGSRASTGSWIGATGIKGTGEFTGLNNKGWTKVEWVIRFAEALSKANFYIYVRDCTGSLFIRDIKLEKGNKATDWSPAPEDVDDNIAKVDTRITGVEANVKTTTDSISSRVATTEQSITTINGSLSSLSTRVSTAEQKITSDAIVSTVRESTDYINDLGKKVGTTEIISKINQTAESVTISANKIGLLGATNIPDLTADKIKGGTLTLGGSNATTQNGKLLVKDASNTDMVKLDKNGIVVKSGHLAVASDFENSTYNFDDNTWTTTTNTSQLDLGDDYIRMGTYHPNGYTNYMQLLDDGLRFQGIAQGVGSWGSFIGHDSIGDFVIQDNVRSNILFKGYDAAPLASISNNGLYVNGPVYGGISIGNAKQFTNVFTQNYTYSHTGYIAIRLGTITRSADSMITIRGHVTSYQNSSSFEVSCYFNEYDGAVYGPVATISNPDMMKEIYFAEGVSDGCVYLILGESDSIWSYPTIAIDSVTVGYDGYLATEWNKGWSATLHSDLSSFKAMKQCEHKGLKKVLWSGSAIATQTLTLNENLRNFKFLTCIVGTPTEPYGIVLGTFLDDDVAELHFGASFTSNNGIANSEVYGAKFNILNTKSIYLVGVGTTQTSSLAVRKIVGWR